ncbi:MAG: PhnD/SsuA/transferrin family substrate-binding protein [Betaproteobacteria bacterium]|nr:PhnD/SsuA/transferrin family substrate-binding protein [Betaproteobacteria bacterium]
MAALAVGMPGTGRALTHAPAQVLRVGLTPAFVHDQHSLMADWRNYLESRLQTPVEFVQRNSYRETMDLLHQERLDFAWLCDYPFLYLKDLVRLLAIPLNHGRPYYRSYLIVGSGDSKSKSMADLKGAVFAYADPYSNTGYLAPRYRLREMGHDPASFFRKTFFTWSHRKLIEAVAKGYADGGAVDSFVFESLEKVKPDIVRRTRIVERSVEYGFPPFAAHRSVSATDFLRMQKALLGMSGDPAGRTLLERLNIDGFIVGDRRMYDGVEMMMRAFGEH